MPPKAAKKTEVAPPEFAHYVEKEPTPLQDSFYNWIVEKTGYEDLDPKSVQLAVALRMTFQRSEENQADLEARREAALAAKEEREARRAEREERAAAKEEEEPAAAPAKRGRPAKATATPAPATKVAAPPRRRAAATSAA